MEESKAGLYIVAVVGLVAVVAMTILVLNVGAGSSTGLTSSKDAAGKMYAVAEDVPGQTITMCTCNYGWVYGTITEQGSCESSQVYTTLFGERIAHLKSSQCNQLII